MTANSLQSIHDEQPLFKEKLKNSDIQVVQEKIYIFLIEIVKVWSPEDVLREFKRLFLENLDSVSLDSAPGIYRLLNLIDNEQDFRNTLKRCCYILVNNWENHRKYKYIQELVQLLLTINQTDKKKIIEKIVFTETGSKILLKVRIFKNSNYLPLEMKIKLKITGAIAILLIY